MDHEQDSENKKTIEENSENVTLRKSSLNKLLTGIITAAIVSSFLAGYVLGSETVEPEKIIIQDVDKVLKGQTLPSIQNESQSSSSLILSVSLDDDPMTGEPNAPITMIEFSDFECPFCLKFHSTTLKQIQTNYINTGKVKFVYRDFPIQSIHPNSVPAALAAECANEQDKFWEFHDLVFINQKNWQDLDFPNLKNTFNQYANNLGLDITKFTDCLESGKYIDEINNDLREGVSYGVTGTPAFFIGNENIGYTKIIGAQPYSVFERLFDEQLGN